MWTHLNIWFLKVDIYEDKDNARKDEIAALGGQTTIGTNLFSAFYDRLKEVGVLSNARVQINISICHPSLACDLILASPSKSLSPSPLVGGTYRLIT